MAEERSTAGWKTIEKTDCPHLPRLNPGMTSEKNTCEECGEKTHLRLCMTCGYVGCCESHHGHDTEHARATDHPFIRPHRCDYDWLWCYACKAFLEE